MSCSRSAKNEASGSCWAACTTAECSPPDPSAGARFNYAPANEEILAKAGALEEICRRHNVALPAVALQFAYAHPVVVSACIGARNDKQQARNAALFESSLPGEVWDDLRAAKLIRSDAPTPQA